MVCKKRGGFCLGASPPGAPLPPPSSQMVQLYAWDWSRVCVDLLLKDRSWSRVCVDLLLEDRSSGDVKSLLLCLPVSL